MPRRKTIHHPLRYRAVRFNSSDGRPSKASSSNLTKTLSVHSLSTSDLTQSQTQSLFSAFCLATEATMTKSKNEDAAGLSASPTAKPSYKRKRKAGEARFYAVRAGRIPGVYTTWAECQNMINGFQGAVYKAFPSREEAILFAAGKNPNPGSTPDRFYAVAVGNRPGIYTEWTEAQAAYTGVKAPKYKKFDTKEAAEEWMQTFVQANFSIGMNAEDDEDEDEEGGLPNPKKIKTQIGMTSGFHDAGGLVEVYTDGSTLANGQEGAVAGVGVFFGDGDPRFVLVHQYTPLAPPPNPDEKSKLILFSETFQNACLGRFRQTSARS